MSAMTGYTPGPWTVDTTNAFGVYGVRTDYATHPGHDGAGYGSQICSMFTVSFQQTDKKTRPQRDANARLIAAAPDLLAACEKFMWEFSDLDEILGDDRRPGIKAREVIEEIRAAITKAKGAAS